MTTSLIIKSMADDTRLSIIRRLAAEDTELACSKIVDECSRFLKLSQPTMSHHFSRLVHSGVLLERKVGTEKFYKLDHDLLKSIGFNPRKL